MPHAHHEFNQDNREWKRYMNPKQIAIKSLWKEKEE